MGRVFSWIAGAVPWSVWVIGAMASALLLSGWLLWWQIERNGALRAELRGAEAAVARARLQMAKQAEIYEAGDRAVVAITEFRDVVVQSRTVAFVRTIYAQPDAKDPAGDSLRATWRRMREIAAGGGSDGTGTARGAVPDSARSTHARPRNPDARRGR